MVPPRLVARPPTRPPVPPVLPHAVGAGALTLEQAHIQPAHTPQGLMRNPATEEQLWSYLVQLTGALRAVHSAGLAVRAGCLAPSKVRCAAQRSAMQAARPLGGQPAARCSGSV